MYIELGKRIHKSESKAEQRYDRGSQILRAGEIKKGLVQVTRTTLC